MIRVLLSRDSFILSVSRRLWSLKNHRVQIPVSFVRQVSTTVSLCSVTVVVLALMEGFPTDSVEKREGD